MHTKYLVALAVSTILPISASAFAQGALAGDAFEQGLELQKQGKFADALAAFQRARANDPTPMAALHVAECEAATGRLVRAEEHLQALVATPIREGSPAAAYAAQAQARIELTELSPRMPHVRIRVSPPVDEAVSLTIDGIAVDPRRATAPQAVDPGVHDIVATASGDRRASSTIRVREGQTAEALLVWGVAPGEAAEQEPSNALRNAGIGVMVAGGVAIGLGFWSVLIGSLMNVCITMGPSSCGHEGDRTMMGGGIAMAAGGFAILTGIGLIVSNRRAKPRPPSVGQVVVPVATRMPAWNTAAERVPTPGAPIVVPIFAGTF